MSFRALSKVVCSFDINCFSGVCTTQESLFSVAGEGQKEAKQHVAQEAGTGVSKVRGLNQPYRQATPHSVVVAVWNKQKTSVVSDVRLLIGSEPLSGVLRVYAGG